ncbi:GYDIA family GHMP kinase [Maribacter sp. 2210JD10-5]|uniref:GYDIA family GHMP kinase n=1 Tax=Maribacter sp. 2210JD10-5 TaxID=3386272 RepID=UPI0039BD4939
MEQEFYSNGKLLLSAEYAILDGAKGLAIPTRYGQSLKIEETDSGKILWKSIDKNDTVWFEASFDLINLSIKKTTDSSVAKSLQAIFLEAKKLNPTFLSKSKGCSMETKLTFPRNWGLGTSSTLINNFANWAAVNPFQLLERTFGGSGYDIACAQNDTPILYHIEKGKPKVENVSFKPDFGKNLFFVYLNQKQNSRDAIIAYRKLDIDKSRLSKKITQITENLVNTSSLADFENLIEFHEQTLSEVLGILPIKKKLFPDYFGTVKSLGAWGGDFILVTGNKDTPNYFRQKGYETIIPYSEMVL